VASNKPGMVKGLSPTSVNRMELVSIIRRKLTLPWTYQARSFTRIKSK